MKSCTHAFRKYNTKSYALCTANNCFCICSSLLTLNGNFVNPCLNAIDIHTYTHTHARTHTHTHPFNGPLSGTTQVRQYQKGKTNLDFTGARESEQQWHQLEHMQVCTSLQTDNHASTSLVKFFTGRMPFLPPNQQCQSTEGNK